MRVVFLSFLKGFGGAKRQNVLLAKELALKGHDVIILSLSVDNNLYDLGDNIQYEFIPDRKRGLFKIIKRYVDIKKRLKELRPDLTVSFWYQPMYLCAMMSKKITGKLVYSERTDPGDAKYKGWLGIVRKITLPRIDGFVFQSKGAQRYFPLSVRKKSTIISNPVFIKAEDYPDVQKRRKAIVTVGRLHPQKNHRLLIEAFSEVASQFPDYVLEIYGDGELKEELQKQIMSLRLNNRVFLKGTSKQVFDLIYDSEIFVLSSDYEGVPNSLLEALALGIPCISTDCRPGGARELIEDGVNGIVVPLNDKDELAAAMIKLLSDKQLAMKYSIKRIDTINKHNPERIYNQWEKYFLKIIDKG